MATELGDFLRACRARLDPTKFGLPFTGPRKVTGLRREELAVVAGMSVDYYTRLEQGREKRPSAQMLDHLCDALCLTADERQHAFDLAGMSVPVRRHVAGTVSPQLRALMDQWPNNPAWVLDANFDILASNRLCDALHAGFTIHDNVARMTFLDAHARSFYTEWDRAARSAVGGLRLAFGRDRSDPRLIELVEELSSASSVFEALWSQRVPSAKTHEAKRLRHDQLGELTLSFYAFDVRANLGQQLVVYYADANSDSHTALLLLGSIAASRSASS